MSTSRPWKDCTDIFAVAIIASVVVTACCAITKSVWLAALIGFASAIVVTMLIYGRSIRNYPFKTKGYARWRFIIDLLICAAVPAFAAGWLALLV